MRAALGVTLGVDACVADSEGDCDDEEDCVALLDSLLLWERDFDDVCDRDGVCVSVTDGVRVLEEVGLPVVLAVNDRVRSLVMLGLCVADGVPDDDNEAVPVSLAVTECVRVALSV